MTNRIFTHNEALSGYIGKTIKTKGTSEDVCEKMDEMMKRVFSSNVTDYLVAMHSRALNYLLDYADYYRDSDPKFYEQNVKNKKIMTLEGFFSELLSKKEKFKKNEVTGVYFVSDFIADPFYADEVFKNAYRLVSHYDKDVATLVCNNLKYSLQCVGMDWNQMKWMQYSFMANQVHSITAIPSFTTYRMAMGEDETAAKGMFTYLPNSPVLYLDTIEDLDIRHALSNKIDKFLASVSCKMRDEAHCSTSYVFNILNTSVKYAYMDVYNFVYQVKDNVMTVESSNIYAVASYISPVDLSELTSENIRALFSRFSPSVGEAAAKDWDWKTGWKRPLIIESLLYMIHTNILLFALKETGTQGVGEAMSHYYAESTYTNLSYYTDIVTADTYTLDISEIYSLYSDLLHAGTNDLRALTLNVEKRHLHPLENHLYSLALNNYKKSKIATSSIPVSVFTFLGLVRAANVYCINEEEDNDFYYLIHSFTQTLHRGALTLIPKRNESDSCINKDVLEFDYGLDAMSFNIKWQRYCDYFSVLYNVLQASSFGNAKLKAERYLRDELSNNELRELCSILDDFDDLALGVWVLGNMESPSTFDITMEDIWRSFDIQRKLSERIDREKEGF